MCIQEMGDVAPTSSSTDRRHDILFQQQANLARYRPTPLPGPFPPLSRSLSVSLRLARSLALAFVFFRALSCSLSEAPVTPAEMGAHSSVESSCRPRAGNPSVATAMSQRHRLCPGRNRWVASTCTRAMAGHCCPAAL